VVVVVALRNYVWCRIWCRERKVGSVIDGCGDGFVAELIWPRSRGGLNNVPSIGAQTCCTEVRKDSVWDGLLLGFLVARRHGSAAAKVGNVLLFLLGRLQNLYFSLVYEQ
jgi:hypothetical protein